MYITSLIPDEINKGLPWSIYAPCNSVGDCDLADFFAGLGANMKSDATNMFALLMQVSESGPQQLPDKICHQLEDGIREFIKGRIRVFWFYDDGKVVICTHAMIKATQSTPRQHIKKAKLCRASYLDAKRNKELIIFKEEE